MCAVFLGFSSFFFYGLFVVCFDNKFLNGLTKRIQYIYLCTDIFFAVINVCLDEIVSFCTQYIGYFGLEKSLQKSIFHALLYCGLLYIIGLG